MRAKQFLLPLLILLLSLAACSSVSYLFRPQQQIVQAAVPASEPADQYGQSLFPSFIASKVRSVSISTPQCTFDLRRKDAQTVSVNGQHGDGGVFTTLLEQIDDLSFVPTEPFKTPDVPLLTLSVCQQDAEYSAAFYADNGSGEFARILIHQNDQPLYGMTEGWRVGTLMLACEGMRVQDADGKEMPLQ